MGGYLQIKATSWESWSSGTEQAYASNNPPNSNHALSQNLSRRVCLFSKQSNSRNFKSKEPQSITPMSIRSLSPLKSMLIPCCISVSRLQVFVAPLLGRSSTIGWSSAFARWSGWKTPLVQPIARYTMQHCHCHGRDPRYGQQVRFLILESRTNQ